MGKSPSTSLPHPAWHSHSTQAKGLLVSIPVLTLLHLQLLCRSIGTGRKKKGGKKGKEKDTKKKESKNKLSAMNGEMDLAEAVGGGDAEETLRDQPTAPTPRNEVVTPRIHQTLWPTGQEKAENSFPLSFAPSLSAFPESSGGLW